MSRLEQRVKPILAPLINGYESTLSMEDQLMIARWASLKAACFDANPRSSDLAVSEMARRQIRGGPSDLQPGRVPDRWAVWLGMYPRPTFMVTMPYASGVGADRNHLTSFNFTMTLGFVVLMVAGRTGGVEAPPLERHPFGFDLTDDATPAPPLLTISPPRKEVRWPLKSSLAPSQLCEAITLELPSSLDLQPELKKTIDFIATHDELRMCNRCEETHARYPVAELPQQQPDDWTCD